MQACGNGQRGRRNRGDASARVAFAFRRQYGLRHLLHEQRNAVGALDDVLPDARREGLVADDAIDHGADFPLSQPIDGEGGDVRSSDPSRIEFRPERHDQQYAKCRDAAHRLTEYFQARGVGPMRILQDHQHWVLACQRLQL